MARKNEQKRRAQPKRSTANRGDKHDLGLWIDYDLLRRHQNHTPTILHEASSAVNHRYLELADLALRKKAKKKSTAATAK